MGDWITCPGCQLKHSGRPDGICPRCKQPVGEAARLDGAGSNSGDLGPRTVEPVAMGLGSLAQSVRGKEIRNARTILLFVGVLSVLVNGFFFFMAQKNVDEAIEEQIKKLPAGQIADPDKVAAIRDTAVGSVHLMAGGGMALGVAFLICALLVGQYPVPATITGLVLYLGGNAVFMLMDPTSIGAGILVKILIVAGLFKAVQAAVAYQKEVSGTTVH